MPGAGDWSRSQSKQPVATPTASSGGAGAASRAAGGGVPAAPTAAKGKKSNKGFLGGVIDKISQPVGGLLGAVTNALSAPQQVLFKGMQAGQAAAKGQYGAAFKTGLGALGEVATAGQAGGDIDFAHAIGNYDKASKTFTPRKLPAGLNTAAGIVADPLNFLTLGAGGVAEQGLKVAEKEIPGAAARIAEQGLKKGLTDAEKQTLKTALVREATDAGAKNAEKTASKQLKALATRGRGGIGFRVPGTGIGGSVVPGTALAAGGEKTGLTAAREAIKGSAPARAVGRALVPGRAVSEAVGKEAGKDVLAAAGRRTATGGTTVNDLITRTQSTIRDFERETGQKFTAAEDKFVHTALEAGPEAMAAAKLERPELARTIDTFDDARKTLGREQIERGLLRGTEAGGLANEETYMHRVLTPEAQKAFKQQEQQTLRAGGSVSASLRQGAAKARTIAPEYTAREINSAIDTLHAGGTVADTTLHEATKGIAQRLKPGEKLYKESAVTSLIDRGVEGARAIASADYVKDLRGIVDDTGEKILLSAGDVAEGAAVPGHFVKFDLPKLGTFYAPKELKAEMVGVMGRMDDVDGLRKALDTADRWWRSQVTASLPGGIPFAARNARSNVMLMWLSGTNVPKYMAEGAGLQRQARRVLKNFPAEVAEHGVEAAMKAHLGERQFKLWDYARKSGIIGDAFYTVELGQAPKIGVKGAAKQGGRARRAVRFVAGTEGTLATKGKNLNEAVEQHARLSQFLSDVDKLGDLEAAARRTKDVLFDYSALTPAEKKFKRWVMPFYTFARKNAPRQMRAFIEAPGRFVLPEKLARATTGPLPEGSPEYQKRQGSRISKVPGLAGLVSTPQRPFQAAVSNFEPFYELATGHGQEGLRGVLSNFGGVPGAPAKALFEQATGRSLFTGYTLPKSALERQKLAAQTAIPSLARAWPLSARLPTATSAQKKKLDASTIAQLLAMAGVQVQPVNEKERKRQLRLSAAAKRAER